MVGVDRCIWAHKGYVCTHVTLLRHAPEATNNSMQQPTHTHVPLIGHPPSPPAAAAAGTATAAPPLPPFPLMGQPPPPPAEVDGDDDADAAPAAASPVVADEWRFPIPASCRVWVCPMKKSVKQANPSNGPKDHERPSQQQPGSSIVPTSCAHRMRWGVGFARTAVGDSEVKSEAIDSPSNLAPLNLDPTRPRGFSAALAPPRMQGLARPRSKSAARGVGAAALDPRSR